jgi:hypothetical protein
MRCGINVLLLARSRESFGTDRDGHSRLVPRGVTVLYAVSWKGRPEVRNGATERFLKSGGRPPEGVRLVGRWHYIGQIAGVSIAESDDPLLMSKWALDWNDLFEMDVRPVATDEQLGPVLAEAVGKQ